MLTPQTIDVSGLNASALRTAQHFVAWLRRGTASEIHQGRYEAVIGEGRVKIAHETRTVAPEDMVV